MLSVAVITSAEFVDWLEPVMCAILPNITRFKLNPATVEVMPATLKMLNEFDQGAIQVNRLRTVFNHA